MSIFPALDGIGPSTLSWIDRIVDPERKILSMLLARCDNRRSEVIELTCDGGPRLARWSEEFKWVHGIQPHRAVLGNAWSYLEERRIKNVVLSSKATLETVQRKEVDLVLAMPSIWTDSIPLEVLCAASSARSVVLLPTTCKAVPGLGRLLCEFSSEAILMLEEHGFAREEIIVDWEAPGRVVLRNALALLDVTSESPYGRSIAVEYAVLTRPRDTP